MRDYLVMDLQDVSATIKVEMRGFGVVIIESAFESFFLWLGGWQYERRRGQMGFVVLGFAGCYCHGENLQRCAQKTDVALRHLVFMALCH